MRLGCMKPVTIGSSLRAAASATIRAGEGGVGLDPGHLLRPGEEAEPRIAPRLGEGERVERLEARAGATRCGRAPAGAPARPRRRPRPDRSSSRATRSGSALFWISANVTGRPIAAARRRIQSISALGGGEVLAERARRGQLEHAGAELAEHPADAEQLVLGGERAGHGLAVDGPVGERAAGGEAERTGRDALLARWRPSPRCPRRWRARCGRRARPSRRRAPRRGAPGCRGPWRAALVERVEVLGEGLPAPSWMPSPSAAPGMSSTPSIRPISHSWRSGGHGREADAAVAHHDGGDAVPARRREQRVPGGLAVVVRVDVDEAGGDERAVGVDLRRGRRRSTAPTSVMTPSVMATSAVRAGAPVPSTTVPPRMTRSCAAMVPPVGAMRLGIIADASVGQAGAMAETVFVDRDARSSASTRRRVVGRRRPRVAAARRRAVRRLLAEVPWQSCRLFRYDHFVEERRLGASGLGATRCLTRRSPRSPACSSTGIGRCSTGSP